VGNARIMSAKVLDRTGQGNESDLAFGLVWCASHGAKVALMALSITDTGPTLDRALQYAYDHDVLMVASAGNGGGAVAYPAADARVVGVEAIDGNLALAPFSARGPGAEVSAPGVDVLGTFPGGAYAFGSGTSQAAAYAAGVAALMRGANPALSAAEATRILETTGQRAPDAPLLDANAALSQAMASSLAGG
jgi:subtilisin family serine protease